MSSAARSSISAFSVSVVAPVFSMPPQVNSLTTTWLYSRHGYGPNSRENTFIMSPVRPYSRRAARSWPANA